MLRCKACAIPVPNSKERRSLESSSSEHVKLGLEACFREDGRCAVATRLHVSTGYVCKKCFLLVDKKVRIKNELEKVKVNLKDKVSRGIESFTQPVSTEELIETIAARFANAFFLQNFCERIFAHVYLRESDFLLHHARSQNRSAIFLLLSLKVLPITERTVPRQHHVVSQTKA